MQNEELVQEFPDFAAVDPLSVEERVRSLLEGHRRRIDELVLVAEPDWASLGQAMEDLSDSLSRLWSPVSHLNAVCNSEALRQAHNACVPLLSQYHTDISQNAGLNEAYRRLAAGPGFAGLDSARRKAVSDTLRDFHLAGVDLPDAGKQRYREISQRLAELASRFGDNLLDATQAWTLHLSDSTRLGGLPPMALEAAQQAALDRGLEGYLFTLDFPSYHAVMTHADDRELRREVYEAYNTRASDQGPCAQRFDNSELITEILTLRQEMAAILGFGNYAEYALATRMATSPAQVLDFLRELARRSRSMAERELLELHAFARELGVSDFSAWDVSYHAEKLRQRTFAISQEELRPYFPADTVLNGLFQVIEKLFGVTLVRETTVPLYHPEARCYRLLRKGQPVAAIYLDLHARENKRGGAWMANYAVRRRRDDGRIQWPVAFIVCNFSRPTTERPALLTHDEVTTLFHEFGHALHHTLTQMDCYDVSGINGVAWDAIELPSQFLENWCWRKEVIPLISGHYQSGEPLPEALLDRLLAAKNFQAGMIMARQLEFALFDFRLHIEYRDGGMLRVQQLLDEVRDEVALLKPPPFNRFQHGFSHIFAGGYAAGYYSYKWAEVLSADAFSLFEEKGIFDPETGRRFLDTILANGGSQEPQHLFKAFRGREPRVDALLRHNGMQEES